MTKAQYLERNLQILQERTNGRTLADIGQEFGLSIESVRRCACSAMRHNENIMSPIWYAPLSERARNVLKNYKLTDRDDALLAFSSGKSFKFANAGVFTILEIKSALGLT